MLLIFVAKTKWSLKYSLAQSQIKKKKKKLGLGLSISQRVQLKPKFRLNYLNELWVPISSTGKIFYV